MADDDLLLHPQFAEQRAEAHAERLHAHQVDLALEQPARVIFAKAGRLHHRPRFVGVGVGAELGLRLGEQGGLGRWRATPLPSRSPAAIKSPSRCARAAAEAIGYWLQHEHAVALFDAGEPLEKARAEQIGGSRARRHHHRLDVVHVDRAEADLPEDDGRDEGTRRWPCLIRNFGVDGSATTPRRAAVSAVSATIVAPVSTSTSTSWPSIDAFAWNWPPGVRRDRRFAKAGTAGRGGVRRDRPAGAGEAERRRGLRARETGTERKTR